MRQLLILLLLIPVLGIAQKKEKDYWKIQNTKTISWNLLEEERLPHEENIEMSGQKVSAIIYYSIDKKRHLSLSRDVIFPQLRTFNKSHEPDWKKYRAYFRRTSKSDVEPLISVNNKTVQAVVVDSISIAGKLTFHHSPQEELQISRSIYPSMTERFIVEQWDIRNTGNSIKEINISNVSMSQSEIGYKGNYGYNAFSKAENTIRLKPNEIYTFPVYFGATLNEESIENFNFKQALKSRSDFLTTLEKNLILETPDPVINQLFYYSKTRASESIFISEKLGLVHSPGGGNYYLGIWANDQVEYSGPFFPYLGYTNGNDAAYNTYKWFKKHIPKDDSHIPYAFEMDGNFAMTHLDRGDASMIAYGTSHYVLAKGDSEIAQELWPLIEWSLEYCHRMKNEFGAVASESDEMEGRIETGTANLSTSSLYYGGLKYAIHLTKELKLKEEQKRYEKRLAEMKTVINTYFSGTIEGLDTYRYFDGNKNLRHWICLPLCMDITDKKEATLEALFDKLWTENGILVELNQNSTKEPVFWDRATLYALRGAFKVGATDKGYEKLQKFSKKRLLGDHVPYVIEAYPENNKKHLSAESALYCRIFTEGMLGIEPQGFTSIRIKPSLPTEWNFLNLNNIQIFGKATNIRVKRMKGKLQLEVTSNKKTIYSKRIKNGESVVIKL